MAHMGDEAFSEAWYVVHTKSRFENVVSEGLVTRVNGPGRIYMQSRSFGGLAAWTNAHLF